MPLFTTIVALAVGGAPVCAAAQTAVFYIPPKLASRGSNTTAVSGKGTVTIKVFVHANGKADVPSVVAKSTNHADDAAALEIARTSTYKPASKDGKPTEAFYTFVLNFTGAGVIGDTPETSDAALQQVAVLERNGNYAGAKAQLATYLQAKPDNREANLLKGVADAFTDDFPAAAAAFDKAGTIPPKYRTLAGKTYANAAVAALKVNDNDGTIAYAGKAIDLTPSAEPYNIRGSAEYAQKKYDVAVTDLEKARDLAIAEKADNHQLAVIETNLTAAYMGAGQSDKGLASAKEVARLDPSITQTGDLIAQYYNDKATALVKSGDRKGAADQLDAGAVAVPKYAVQLYGNAATILASDSKPDWKVVKAEADKALAIDPNDARSNYVAGVALANDKNTKDALTYLNKAQASAKTGNDADLSKQIDAALKQLGGTAGK
ncbi:MAG: tetratricopeptide repeat protein [Candidatus Velthaea sp.]|jgi:Tfp pilus assembly protein PilF